MNLIPLSRFRIFAPRSRYLYYEIFVWKHLRQLRRVHRIIVGRRREESKVLGLCYRYKERVRKTNRLTPCMGEVHFHVDHIGAGVVSHEMTHAAVGWLSRKGMNLDLTRAAELVTESSTSFSKLVKDNEEELCFAVGEFSRRFYVFAERLGVIKQSNQRKLGK